MSQLKYADHKFVFSVNKLGWGLYLFAPFGQNNYVCIQWSSWWRFCKMWIFPYISLSICFKHHSKYIGIVFTLCLIYVGIVFISYFKWLFAEYSKYIGNMFGKTMVNILRENSNYRNIVSTVIKMYSFFLFSKYDQFQIYSECIENTSWIVISNTIETCLINISYKTTVFKFRKGMQVFKPSISFNTSLIKNFNER